MPKHTTRRQKKMRGGERGELLLSWTVNNKAMSGTKVFNYIMKVEEAQDVDILEEIKAQVEQHVKDAGYTSADIDKEVLDIVDVEHSGVPPAVPDLVSDTGAETDPPIVFSVKFKYSSRMAGGKKRRTKKTKGRRQH